jgi:signal transduction histidine kinase
MPLASRVRALARVGGLAQRARHRLSHSLRARLALWYGALLAVVLLAFGIGVYLLMSSAITEGSMAEVRAEARVAQAEIQRTVSDTAPYWPANLTLETVDTDRQPGVSVAVYDQTGHMRFGSGVASLLESSFAAPLLAAPVSESGAWHQISVSGARYLVLAQPVQTSVSATVPTRIGTLLVAKSLADANSALATLSSLLVAGSVLAIVGAIVGGGIIARGVLRPLAEVTATAGSIAAGTASGTRLGNLSQRVRPPRSQDELAQLVETFNTMLAGLERATSAQHRFVQDASHELRVPLTIVRGNLTLLQEHGARMPEEERAELLAAAQEETERLTGLVNELLALASADSARGEGPAPSAAGTNGADGPVPSLAAGPRTLVDLDRIVLDLARRMQARLAAEQSAVELNILHLDPVQVRGNEEGLRKVGLILLDNAVKYTPAPPDHQEGTGRASIGVALWRRGAEAELQVRDTGIGIAPDDLAHIFDRLYRADHARDRQGAGLGLAIARAIVERHGGTISVESAPARGSTFTVRLPLASAALPTGDEDEGE